MNYKIFSVVLLVVCIVTAFAVQMETTVAQSSTPTFQPAEEGCFECYPPNRDDVPQPTDPYEPKYIWSVDWSPDNSKIAYSRGPDRCDQENGQNSYGIKVVVDAVRLQPIATLDRYFDCAKNTISWSPNSENLLITAPLSGGLVWNPSKGTELYFSALLATGGGDIATNGSSNTDLSWSPDGKLIACSVSGFSGLYIWNSVTGKTVLIVPNLHHLNAISWSPDGKQLATSEDNITLRDAKTGDVLSTFPENGSILRWSPDGSKIAAANRNNQIVILDAHNGNVIRTFIGHTNWVTNIRWRADNQLIGSSSRDGSIRLWDIESGNQVGIFNSDGPIYDFDWNADGSKFAYGNNSGVLQIISTSNISSMTASTLQP